MIFFILKKNPFFTSFRLGLSKKSIIEYFTFLRGKKISSMIKIISFEKKLTYSPRCFSPQSNTGTLLFFINYRSIESLIILNKN